MNPREADRKPVLHKQVIRDLNLLPIAKLQFKPLLDLDPFCCRHFTLPPMTWHFLWAILFSRRKPQIAYYLQRPFSERASRAEVETAVQGEKGAMQGCKSFDPVEANFWAGFTNQSACTCSLCRTWAFPGWMHAEHKMNMSSLKQKRPCKAKAFNRILIFVSWTVNFLFSKKQYFHFQNQKITSYNPGPLLRI